VLLTALIVLPDGTTTAHPLPESGVVGIGRSEESGIEVPDASISRRHALLHVGPPPAIEDLGSSNGTAIRGTRIEKGATAKMLERRLKPGERAEIAPGDVVHLGSAVLLLQPGRAEGHPAPKRRPAATGVVLLDPAMRDLYALAERIARGDIGVLLLGETGAGKEVLAEAIHRASPRAKKPLVKLNCASFTEQLLESELFGHERGAFTGAAAAKPGLLESADGGTVFLDEVGELSPTTQAKLLRALEDGQVLRVGGLKPRPIDVRFVAATNRDLLAEVQRGAFRQDLYFRLAAVCLAIPPLRERPAEIEPLARTFLARACERLGRAAPDLSAEALARLASHKWPGNARELRNVMERAALICEGGAIGPQHLDLGRGAAPAAAQSDLRGEMESLERKRIVEALERSGGNQTRAAEILGMPRRTLVKRLAQYGIDRTRR